MSQNLKFALRFSADTRQFVNGVGQADRAVEQLGQKSTSTAGTLRDLDAQSDQLSTAMTNLKSHVMAAVGGFAALASVRGMVGVYRQQALLIDQTAKHADLLGITTEALTQFRHAGEMTGITSNNLDTALQRMTRRVAEAATGSGEAKAAIEELGFSAAALSQLTPEQMLYKFADGFKQVESQSDRVRLAFKLFDTEGVKLANLLKLGSESLREMTRDADALGITLNRFDASKIEEANTSLYRAQAAWQAWQQEMVIGVAPTLEVVADNLTSLSTAIGVTLTVALGRGIAALGNKTAASLRATLAERSHQLALVAQTKQTIAVTSAEIARLQSLQLSNGFIFRSTGGEKALAIARAQLTAATTTLTTAQARLNVVARAGTGVLAMLGGPLGIAMMAAGALAYFGMQADSAKLDTEQLKHEVDGLLGRMQALEATRLNGVIEKQKTLVAELRGEYRKLAFSPAASPQSLWQRLFESNSEMRERQIREARESAEAVSAIQKQLMQAEADLSALEARLAGSQSPSEPTGISSSANSEQTAAAERQLATLKRQVAMLGQRSEAAKIAYEVEQGGLKNVSDALKNQLRLEAQKLDNKAAALEAQQRQQELERQGDSLLAQLEQQIALHGVSSEVAKVRYEIEKGSLQGINASLAENILLQAARLDQLNETGSDSRHIDAFYAETDALNDAWLLRSAIMADRENEAKTREEYAYGERLSRLSAVFQRAYTQAQDNQSLQDQLESEYFASREILRAEHEANLTDIERQAIDERAEYQRTVADNLLTFTEQQLGITTNFLRGAGEEQSSIYRVLFAAQKMAAIPSMIISTEEAAMKAMAAYPAPAGPALAAAVRTMGYASVGIVAGTAIAGQAHDGINRVPAANEGTWMLRKDEMVLNPKQADNFRWMVGVMSQMKQMQAQQQQFYRQPAPQGGGSPNVNVSPAPVHVAFLDNEAHLAAYLRSDIGEEAVVKIVQRNRGSF
ncbi:hypothetical protein [Thaumasiovibrio subtropicus]|uniref:hypothetical protein n=1 Tax=Thaumasiovibrio subtropicus TaxID=1891207 RepID=UPI000B34C05A|nr:hypothetical protein [Thaumasiovibrio subtropicus]